MTFLSPLALAWLLLVPVLVLLYLRRRARARREVSNLFLWRAAVERLEARPRLHRLRSNLQLLLQAGFVCLVVLALATPVVSCGGADRVVFVIDSSASMQGAHGGRTRLDEARARAVDVLGRLSRGDQVAVLTAGGTPRVVQELTSNHSRVREALVRGEAEAGGADLDAAIALAWTAIAPRPDRVHLFTDISALLPDSAFSPNVDVVRVGAPAANVAITRLALRRHPGSGLDSQAFVEVANFSDASVRVPLKLLHGDRELHGTVLTLDSGARRSIAVDLDDPRLPVSARIDVADALAADNAATTDPVAAPARVLLLAANQPYVRAALEANSLVRLVGDPDQADVIACEQCNPSGTSQPLLILRRAAGRPVPLTVVDRDHPAMAFAGFDDLVASAAPARSIPGGRALVTAGGAPAVVASDQDGRRMIEVGLDVGGGTVPSSTAFPVFLANAVEWLRGTSGSQVARTIADTESDLRARAPGPTAAPASVPREQDQRNAARAVWRIFLAAAALVLATLYFRFRGERHVPAVRVVVATLLLASLAGFEIAAGAARRHVVFVLDVSASITRAERTRAAERIAALVKGAQPGDLASLITFGGQAFVEARRTDAIDAASPASSPDTEATDIAAALRLARTLAAPDGRILLLSDGNETRGDARIEAGRLGSERLPVDVVAPAATAAARAEVFVASLEASEDVRAHEPFELAATVHSSVPQPVMVRLLRGGAAIAQQRAEARGTVRVRFTERGADPGVLRYDVEVEAARDAIGSNNRAGAVVHVAGPARVLYISPRGSTAGAASLRSGGFEVTVSTAAGLPLSPAGLANTDVVVLDGIAAGVVAAAQREALATWVEQSGGGLVVTGADGFGPGGWSSTRLEQILPVDVRPPARRDASESALVLVLDKSGSMAEVENGTRKIDVAIRAAVPLVDLFAASRTLGVLAFDTTPVPLVRLGEIAEPRAMLDRMRAVTAGGGTTITPAIEMARAWLHASGARRRHIVLLSDGRSSAADVTALRAAAARGDVTISTVGVGEGVDRALLQAVAAQSGGRAHFPGTIAQLPDIFMQEATLAASTWRIEERFTPVAEGAHPLMRGIEAGALGTASGYVATTIKPAGEVVLATHRRDPLLATWQRGLGRTAVLTTDLEARWTATLRNSPAFAQLWIQTARWVARPRDTHRLHPEITVRGTQVTVGASAFTREGGFLNGLDVRAAIQPDGSSPTSFVLRQVAPGRYEAPPAEMAAGFHMLRLTASGGSAPHEAVITGINVSAAPEYAAAEPNLRLLEDIARLSGGTMVRADNSPFERATPSARTIDMRQPLGGAMLLLFVADVAIARGLLRRRARARLETTS